MSRQAKGNAARAAALEERIAAYRKTAKGLLADLERLVVELEGSKFPSPYYRVQLELTQATELLEMALDYLTPRADDDEPECCAHRALQKLAQGLSRRSDGERQEVAHG